MIQITHFISQVSTCVIFLILQIKRISRFSLKILIYKMRNITRVRSQKKITRFTVKRLKLRGRGEGGYPEKTTDLPQVTDKLYRKCCLFLLLVLENNYYYPTSTNSNGFLIAPK